jgi:hypothetical protein
MGERQIPDLGGTRREREPHDLGVARLDAGRLDVERHQRRPAEPLDQRRNLARVIDHGDGELGGRVQGEPVVGGQGLARGRRLGGVGLARRLGGRRWRRAVRGRCRGTPLPCQLPRQAEELQLGQNPDGRLLIGLLQGEAGDVELDRHVALDRDQLPAQPRVVGLAEERLAGALGAHLGRVRQDGLEVAVLEQQLLRPLLADPLHAGDVVGAVSHQREVVHHLRWRHAKSLVGVGFIDPGLLHGRGAATPGIEQRHPGADQLVEVLVSRDDHRLHPAVGRGGGEGADHVIGLVAGHDDQRHAERREQRPDPVQGPVEVGLQLLVQLFPGGLVVGIPGLAERGAGVVDPRDVIGAILLPEPKEEVRHAPRGGGVLAFGGAKRTRDHREEGAIDQRVAVDEEEAGGHRRNGLTPDGPGSGSARTPPASPP